LFAISFARNKDPLRDLGQVGARPFVHLGRRQGSAAPVISPVQLFGPQLAPPCSRRSMSAPDLCTAARLRFGI